VKYGNRPVIEKALVSHFENKAKTILQALRPGNLYYEQIREQIIDLSKQYGLEADIIF